MPERRCLGLGLIKGRSDQLRVLCPIRKSAEMKNIIVVGFIALLAACTTVDDGMPKFEKMSEEELAAYNAGRNLSQMIVCQDDTSTMSRVRRRRCATVEVMYGTGLSAEQLNILTSSPGLQE